VTQGHYVKLSLFL